MTGISKAIDAGDEAENNAIDYKKTISGVKKFDYLATLTYLPTVTFCAQFKVQHQALTLSASVTILASLTVT